MNFWDVNNMSAIQCRILNFCLILMLCLGLIFISIILCGTIYHKYDFHSFHKFTLMLNSAELVKQHNTFDSVDTDIQQCCMKILKPFCHLHSNHHAVPSCIAQMEATGDKHIHGQWIFHIFNHDKQWVWFPFTKLCLLNHTGYTASNERMIMNNELWCGTILTLYHNVSKSRKI